MSYHKLFPIEMFFQYDTMIFPPKKENSWLPRFLKSSKQEFDIEGRMRMCLQFHLIQKRDMILTGKYNRKFNILEQSNEVIHVLQCLYERKFESSSGFTIFSSRNIKKMHFETVKQVRLMIIM